MKRVSLLLATATATVAVSLAACKQSADKAPAQEAENPYVVEGYPEDIANSIREHEAAMAAAAAEADIDAAGNVPFSSVLVNSFHRWEPGAVVTVAFQGGNPALYAQIENVANQWTQPGLANLKFSFRDAKGSFRQWTNADTSYAGDIRIAFGPTGFWSHVGTDSRVREIRGGSPNQASMNFKGFDVKPPANWQVVVLHEFGHALGLEHEHSSPAVECGFRYLDDPGYVPSRDIHGTFIPDNASRRPGLYTYLGGPPNNWSKEKIDFNLGSITKSTGLPLSYFEVTPYDRASIMEYYFEPDMFIQGKDSPCSLERENAILSAQDKVSIAKAYQSGAAGQVALDEQNKQVSAINESPTATSAVRRAILERSKGMKAQ